MMVGGNQLRQAASGMTSLAGMEAKLWWDMGSSLSVVMRRMPRGWGSDLQRGNVQWWLVDAASTNSRTSILPVEVEEKFGGMGGWKLGKHPEVSQMLDA
jgi:hypothetical protein